MKNNQEYITYITSDNKKHNIFKPYELFWLNKYMNIIKINFPNLDKLTFDDDPDLDPYHIDNRYNVDISNTKINEVLIPEYISIIMLPHNTIITNFVKIDLDNINIIYYEQLL